MKRNQRLLNLLSILCILLILAACAPAPAATEAPAANEPVTLTWLIDDSQQSQEGHKAIADAYMALHPNVKIEFETRGPHERAVHRKRCRIVPPHRIPR
jgi:ABC-type glycerol-3-phosphate transport system substrate-binding protein